VTAAGIRVDQHDHDGERVIQPVLDVVSIRSIPPAAGTGLIEEAPTTLYLKGEKPPCHDLSFDHLGLGIDSVVLARLLAEQPAQLIDRSPDQGDAACARLRRSRPLHV
jgi:hypothetical protein